MGAIKCFEGIEAWKSARELTNRIYGLTRQAAFAKDFAPKDQICRAAVSILSNIAEGFESQTRATFVRHLGIAKGSAGEVRSQLYVALDQGYISKAEFDSACELSIRVSRQIARFRQYLETYSPPR